MDRTAHRTAHRSLRLVGYVRVSTERQTEGESLPAQRTQLAGWARAQGHRLVAVYEDAGVSGSNGLEARLGLYEALEAIGCGHADGLLVKNLDRLARKLTVQEAVLAKVWEGGGVVFSVEDGAVLEDDTDDPMRTAMRQIRGVFAQLERAMIVKRMRDGRQHKADRGGFAYGSPPFGWRTEGGSLVEDASEQATLKLMLDLQREGRSTREIAQRLNAEGLRSKRGGGWSSPTVARTLSRHT